MATEASSHAASTAVEASMEPGDDSPSLIIPISNSELFVEIFPEEMGETPVSTLMQVLKDENADVDVWRDASLLYMQQTHARESLTLLEEACSMPVTDKDKRVRVLAATGIAHLAVDQHQSGPASAKRSGGTDREDADRLFTQAGKVDTFFPMTWIGRGMHNLSGGRLDQARFFFQTTLKQCGPVMPALLGMAAVTYGEKDYQGAQQKYAEAIRRNPKRSGASARVGFGLASYRLGQVDRAKAAFARALDMDPECVEAMVGTAVLDLAGLDETAKDFSIRTEKAIKLISMANMLDHSNAMVQNVLSNHYFMKWTPVTGSVEVLEGSTLVKGSQSMPLDAGERIRIGNRFETTVEDVDVNDDETLTFRIHDPWKEASATNHKLWKKDYDRVVALAKGAYGSTSVPEVQAESLFFLARVYHIREDTDNAFKFYERACKLNPELAPARFGLAQTLVVKEEYAQAMEHLNRLLSTSGHTTDTLALLGLLEARSSKTYEEGLSHLRKAIELDPSNPRLLTLEALVLQQRKAMYVTALDRYKKAIDLTKRKTETVHYEVYTNSGVLCHETKRFDESLDLYRLALKALDKSGSMSVATLDNVGVEGGYIRHDDNDMFCAFVDSTIYVVPQLTNPYELKVVGLSHADVDSLPLFVGDLIKVDGRFKTEISKIKLVDGDVIIETKDDYESSENSASLEPVAVLVKRENRILRSANALTIAFNIARLHEAAGRIIAAIELHKAILKRNPAYVNSSLRLACIAVDCGCLKECSEWLKIAATTAPGNPEVLTLIGNLHLSLCDWAAAQPVFDGLLMGKIPNVEAYAALSLGNIYFANLHVSEKRYGKHLQYAADFYRSILSKDSANAYAANGLGTVLAEKGEIFKAKDVFNRVREVSGDSIADAVCNLGHILLAQKKHPEALQMYQTYMKRTVDATTPITSKSRVDDLSEVLLYISFAYFDWARHTELFNDVNAAPADERYKLAMQHLEAAIEKHPKKEVVLKYNLCMTKLQAANCVLQKSTRNISRTVDEVEDALNGLNESLEVVEQIIRDKNDGKKVPIPTSTLQNFVTHCRANISSAESHLEDERHREVQAEKERILREEAADAEAKAEELEEEIRKTEEVKKQAEYDMKADAAMKKVDTLRESWQHEQEQQQAQKEKRAKKRQGQDESDFIVVEDENAVSGDHGLFDDSSDSEVDDGARTEERSGKKSEERTKKPSSSDLFGDSDDEEEKDTPKEPAAEKPKPAAKELFGDSDDSDDDAEFTSAGAEASGSTEVAGEKKQAKIQELFGDSDEESDEELLSPNAKREAEGVGDDQPNKKRRVLEDDD